MTGNISASHLTPGEVRVTIGGLLQLPPKSLRKHVLLAVTDDGELHVQTGAPSLEQLLSFLNGALGTLMSNLLDLDGPEWLG